VNCWLIRPDVLRELDAARRGLGPLSAERIDSIRARIEAEALGGTPRLLTVNGADAFIAVEGPLVKRVSYWMYELGYKMCAYGDLAAALTAAGEDRTIKRVHLVIDSPGGTVDGLFEVMQQLAEYKKPLLAHVAHAYSGAYMLASQCKKIEAIGPASGFGSVGIATTYGFWDGEEIIDITNTESPDKRPDVRTEEGRAVIQRELDEYAEIIAKFVAAGRTAAGKKIAASEVFEAYGRGACFLTAEAKRRSMIDSVAKPAVRSASAEADADQEQDDGDPASSEVAASSNPTVPADGPPKAVQPAAPSGMETRIMSIKELKAQHPDLFAEVFEEGRKAGVAGERERVSAHLTLGKASGALDVAHEAIERGADLGQAMQAKYLAAGMNKTSADARTTEGKDAAAAVAGAVTQDAPDLGDQAVTLIKGGKVQS
jgi:ClpP class serine protease